MSVSINNITQTLTGNPNQKVCQKKRKCCVLGILDFDPLCVSKHMRNTNTLFVLSAAFPVA